MVVGSMEIQVRLQGCNSLKEKRHILRPVIERVRHDFNVAIAEVEDQDLWGNASIGVACVSNDVRHAESILQHVVEAFEERPQLTVDSASKTIERY